MKKFKQSFNKWKKVSPHLKFLVLGLFIVLCIGLLVIKYRETIRVGNNSSNLAGNDDQSLIPDISSKLLTDLSNWKTYRSKKIGITFKYPSNVRVNEPDNEDGIYFGIEPPEFDSSLLVIYKLSLQGQSLEEYVTKKWQPSRLHLEEVKIGAFVGKQFDRVGFTGGRHVFVTDDKNNFGFRTFYFFDPVIQEKYQTTINTILSTLKKN